MKKILALFLALMILTNFHCSRLQIQTENPGAVLATCRANLLEGNEKNPQAIRGFLVLEDEHIRFITAEKALSFSYENVRSISLEKEKGIKFPLWTGPHFTEKEKNSGLNFFFILMMALFGILSFFAWLMFFGDSSFSMPVEVLVDGAEGEGIAVFRLNGGEFKKIYSILDQKI